MQFKLFTIFILFKLTNAAYIYPWYEPRKSDVESNVIELIKSHGYPVEEHKNVQTEDGYLLELHRIPYGLNNTSKRRPVVLLMHGLLCSSADWIITGPENGLAYILAEEGYDVWMGNQRGNTWSRKHVKLNPNKSKFWDFSWHEIGYYDLPAMIDYVLNVTGKNKLSYVGHSQGTAAFFVMTSEKPEYNKKINLMSALAPIGFMKKVPSLFIQVLARFEHSLKWIAKFIGLNEFMPHSELFAWLGNSVCKDEHPLQPVCSNILFLIAGVDAKINTSMYPAILSHTPAGASTKQLLHFAQEIKSGKFRPYDYGIIKNLIKYGKISPPSYNLENIKIPVALYYGENDILAHVDDVTQLYRSLPNAIIHYKVPDKSFGHLDFLWAMEAPQILYKRVISIMKRYK